MPRKKKPDSAGTTLKFSPEGEKRIRKLMTELDAREKARIRDEEARIKKDKRLIEKHRRKMAWYDRFDKSIEKLYRQMLAMHARMKRDYPGL